MIALTDSKSPTRRTVQVAEVQRDYAPRERVAGWVRRAAVRLGKRPGTLHQQLYGRTPLPQTLAVAVEEARRDGALDAVSRLTAPIDAAAAGQVATPVSRAMVLRWGMAIADALAASLVFLASQGGTTAFQWARTLGVVRSVTLELLTALRHQV